MSLFPAYASAKSEPNVSDEAEQKHPNEEDNSWLQNASFVPVLAAPPPPETDRDRSPLRRDTDDSPRSRDKEYRLSHHKHKKSKKHKRDKVPTAELLENDYGGKRSRDPETNDEEPFYIDKKKEPSFYGMKRLTGPNVPRYPRPHQRPLGWSRVRGSGRYYKIPRYYKSKTLAKALSASDPTVEEDERPEWNHNTPMELKETTEKLNKRVSREPTDIEAWLELTRLQPSLLALAPRSGPCLLTAVEKRAVTDKQISILDKALEHNPSCPQLVKERYGLASMIVPADALAADLRSRLELQPLLLAGWLQLARLESSHLASCSVPRVAGVYAQALTAVSNRRRREPIHVVENTILALVLAVGQFLQEAGLMEQVWTLLRLYFEPSLPHAKDPAAIAEMQVSADERAAAWEALATRQEDDLLSSGLPSSELWLRVERLRESAHLLPARDCVWAREGDPQRLVFPEDLADLSQPITLRDLGLSVAATCLMVLGAPPLPASHTATSVMGQSVPLVYLGALAAAASPLIAPDIASPLGPLGSSVLEIAATSGSGPLASGPGGLLYRQLLALTFARLADRVAEEEEGRALLGWWLRVEALFARIRPDKETASLARSAAKRFLKRPEHRAQVQLFREFALFETAATRNLSAAEKILLPIVQASRGGGAIIGRHDCAAQVSVYRTLAEVWALQGHWDKVTALLVALADEGSDPFALETPAPTTLARALAKFQQGTTQILAMQKGDEDVEVLDLLCEDVLVSWVSCHAWLLLASSQTVWSSGALLETMIARLMPCTPNSRASRQREDLFTTYAGLLEVYQRFRPGGASMLRSVVSKALSEFPDNASLLALSVVLPSPLGLQDSSLVHRYKPDQVLSGILHGILLEQRTETQERAERDAFDTEGYEKCHPKVIAHYEKLVSYCESRHCPLVWRFYLRYVGRRGKPELVKSVFYKALEDCPWVKALYLQGASLLPEELGNIQDLLVEKELRLHVAPEELEILRSD